MTLQERKEQLLKEHKALEELLVKTHNRLNFVKGALAMVAELEPVLTPQSEAPPATLPPDGDYED